MDYNLALLNSMREAWGDGRNSLEAARQSSASSVNSALAIEIAYDLQAGSYIHQELVMNRDRHEAWIKQTVERLRPYLKKEDAILEIGAGDGTTLFGLVPLIPDFRLRWAATDISFSRCLVARDLLSELEQDVNIWASDMFNLPLADNSVDVVFTSHALEPNGGHERDAIKELTRVARRAVILFEPIWELAPTNARRRMDQHGYVRGLRETTISLGLQVLEHELLPSYKGGDLNPSGILVISTSRDRSKESEDLDSRREQKVDFVCPLTGSQLTDLGDCLFTPTSSLAYPKISGIPILRRESAIVASALSGSQEWSI